MTVIYHSREEIQTGVAWAVLSLTGGGGAGLGWAGSGPAITTWVGSCPPALLPSAPPNHLHLPFQIAAVLVLHLRLAIKLQAEVFRETCHGIMNDPKQSKQDISSTRALLLLVGASGKLFKALSAVIPCTCCDSRRSHLHRQESWWYVDTQAHG